MTTEREKLESGWRTYARQVRPSIWNNPSAKLEAGRCLTFAHPWDEYVNVCPTNERDKGYWRDVADHLFKATCPTAERMGR